MKKIKFLAMLIMAVVTCTSFSACSDDDDDNGGGGSVTSSSLVGRSFKKEYIGIDGDGNPEEDTTTITFISTTECSVNSKGYDYIWYNGYKKESYNETKSCKYSVSGDKITLHSYPFFAFGDDFILTYKGSYLTDGAYTFYEK